jgi:hypothetical protein
MAKFDPDKLTLLELVNIVFAKASAAGIQLRMRFIYPKPAKPAKKKARRAA